MCAIQPGGSTEMGQWCRSLARLPPASLFAMKKDPQAARRVHHNNWPGRARLEGIDGSCTTPSKRRSDALKRLTPV